MALNNQDAITILRDDGGITTVGLYEEAKRMGAQALEAWVWVERTGAGVTNQSGKWHCAVGWFTHTIQDTPLAAVLDAMEKEGKV